MLRRTLAVLAAATLSLAVLAQPAYADSSTTLPNTSHSNGGVVRAKFSDGSILWASDGEVLVQWDMEDTSTDTYAAKVWVEATFTTYYGTSTLHPKTIVTRTDGTGNVVYKNSGWIPRYAYCSNEKNCDQPTSYDTADYVEVYIGRTAGDRTKVGKYTNPYN
jgi:hypothetical protein